MYDDLDKCYHIEVGNKRLYGQILSELDLTLKDLFTTWYKAYKWFKYWPKSRYTTTNLRRPNQYMVSMMCKLYGETDATHFPLSYMTLFYLCAHVVVSFNWVDILFENVKDAMFSITQAQLRSFPNFHMYSYILDIICIAHKYTNMGWIWFPSNVAIHIYCKVIWEHK
jgi:hypothetical protein